MKSRMEIVLESVKQAEKLSALGTYGALELEAAAALLMLRYQYDIKVGCTVAQTTSTVTKPPPPPPPAAAVVVVDADKCTPKELVRTVASKDSSQPLKKRSIPPHLLRRSLTPARSTPLVIRSVNRSSSGNGGGGGSSNSSRSSSSAIVKAKLKVEPVEACNKALLKSCRNMIREFLDNQELF